MIDDDGLAARTEAFLDCLRLRRDPAAEPRAFPDLVATLSWTNDDNGHALERVRERWLREGDLGRTGLAFEMNDVYPGRGRAEILANLTAAVARFPQFRARAEAVLEHWDARRFGEPGREPAFAVLAWDPAPPMALAEAVEFIADHPAPNAPPKFLAEIVDELLPCLTAAAQAEIHAVCDAWASGPDEWRAAIAVSMEVPAPGRTSADLARRRAAVADPCRKPPTPAEP
jgi:hypothetical protein